MTGLVVPVRGCRARLLLGLGDSARLVGSEIGDRRRVREQFGVA